MQRYSRPQSDRFHIPLYLKNSPLIFLFMDTLNPITINLYYYVRQLLTRANQTCHNFTSIFSLPLSFLRNSYSEL